MLGEILAWPYGLVLLVSVWLLGFALVWRRSRARATKPASQAPPPRRSRAPKGTAPPPERISAVLYLREAHAELVRNALKIDCTIVKSAEELAAKVRDKLPSLFVVDIDLVEQVEGVAPGVPRMAIVDEQPADALGTIVGALDGKLELSHIVAIQMLRLPNGGEYLAALVDRLTKRAECDLLGPASVGRVAMLARASHREARFARIEEYFSKQGISARTITGIHDIAEELIMNALYDAPMEAGFLKHAVARTEDLELPRERACEISYGMESGSAFVRVRDSFGALRRQRLVDVLQRCAAENVELDESRGGAGLGIWRVFTTATTVSITVVPGQLTDILIRVAPRTSKAPKHLLAVSLFFGDETAAPLEFDSDSSPLDKSITMFKPL